MNEQAALKSSIEENSSLEPKESPIDSLMETGHFKNSAEASEFLEKISKSFEIIHQNQESTNAFLEKLQEIIFEAEKQVKEIEANLKDANSDNEAFIDKKEAFKNILTGIIKNFEEIDLENDKSDPKNTLPGLIRGIKKLGSSIKENRRALQMFTIASVALRLFSGSAEASEIDQPTPEMMDFAGISPQDFEHENIDSNITGESIEDIMNNNPSENFLALIDEIHEAEKMPGAIVEIYDDSTNQEPYEASNMTSEMVDFAGIHSDQKGMSEEKIIHATNDIMEDIKNGIERTFEVRSYWRGVMEEKNETIAGKENTEFKNNTEYMNSFVPIDTSEKNNSTHQASIELYGIGDSPESAFLSALEEFAKYKGVTVNSSSESEVVSIENSSNPSLYDRFAKRTEISCNETISVKDFKVEEKISNNGNHHYFEVTINSN